MDETTAENKKPRVEKYNVESTDNLGSILDNDEDDEEEGGAAYFSPDSLNRRLQRFAM